MGRSWILTIHQESWDASQVWKTGEHSIRYMCGQLERGEKTGALHWQVYVELKRPFRLKGLKDLIGCDSAHCEERAGTREAARNYCQKDETYISGRFEYGSWESGGQGARSDLIKFKDTIMTGADDYDIMMEHPECFIKYGRALDRIRAAVNERKSQRFRDIKVNVIVGATGVGKTRGIYDKHGYTDVYTLTEQGGDVLWFDAYRGQPILLIDEFYGWIKYSMLLKILDGHPFHGQVKGGWTWANWELIYITSNKTPDGWYEFGVTPALARRITNIEYIDIEEND